ncbi:MAG TPA: hypothetical protein VFY87_10535 [Geminicoccaceae bacterium]|nr:hypothetical protein [Geminicoccaceae bacterium]
MARTPPEGKARSRRNVPKHGLRAKLLPLPLAGDDAARFQELAAGLRRTYRPEDEAEAQLVDAIAVAMWQEIATDRLEAEALAAMAGGEGRPFHGDGLLFVDEEVCTNELPPPPAPASTNDDSAGTPTDRTNDFDSPDRTRASPRRCAAVAARLAAGGGR